MVKLTEALGSLWFSTIITVNPFFKVNLLDSPSLTFGAGPGSGILLRSIWALAAKDIAKMATNDKIFVFIIFYVF